MIKMINDYCILIIVVLCGSVSADTAMMNSFSKGEITPKLGARSDVKLWYSACQELSNFFTNPQGGVKKRPGTYYIPYVDGVDITPAVPAVPAIPEVPPRDEAYIAANSDAVFWFDKEWNLLEEEFLDGGNSCSSVDVDSTGIVVAGFAKTPTQSNCIRRWDVEMNSSDTFFVPDEGWDPLGAYVGTLRFTDDDAYLYAVVSSGTHLANDIYKFDAVTGDMVWTVANSFVQGPYSMCVDEHDDIYVGGWGGAAIHKLSGETGAAISSTVGFVTGNTFDDVEDRIYSVGSLFGYSAEYGWMYTQVGASNVDNSEYVNYSVNYSGGGCNNVIVVDSNIFVVGGYMDGAGGAEETATVWKFDRNLNLLASANTGSDVLGVVLDWDGNIACYAGSIFTYTTDLVFVAEHEIVPVTHAIYGNEIQKIDYLYGSSEGVPGVPAVPAVETAVEVDPRRLVPFVRADEYSNVLALGDKNISFFEGD